MVNVKLLGRGGVMPLPHRPLTSLLLEYSGKALLVDCGEGTQVAIRNCGGKFSRIDALLLTHLHADHISGLVGFLLTMGLEGRVDPLRIYGPCGTAVAFKAMMIIAPCLPFEVNITEISDDEFEFYEIGLKINAFSLKHSVDCIGYRFELERLRKFLPQKAKALGIPVKLWSILQNGMEIDGFSPDDVSGEARKGICLLYATDTRPTAAIEKYGKDMDLMILEGMYGDHENDEKAELAGHMTMKEAVTVAKNTKPRMLWLTHYSPSVSDPTVYSEELLSIFQDINAEDEPISAVLKFE